MNFQEQERWEVPGAKRVKRSPLATDTEKVKQEVKLSPLATNPEKVKQEVKLGDKDILFILDVTRLIGIDLNRLRIESHRRVNSSNPSDQNCYTLPKTSPDFEPCGTLTRFNSPYSSYQYCCTLPNAPIFFDVDLYDNRAVGCFVFRDKLFTLGGSFPYKKGVEDVWYNSESHEDRCPLGVCEVKFDSSKLNATAQDVLSLSDTVPDFPKPPPIVEVIGNKVYILNTFYDGRDFDGDFRFKCLDFDAPLPWTTIQNPPIFDPIADDVDIEGHFVLGSRLYLVVSGGIGVRKPLSYCYFDTKTSSWALDHSILQSINDFPVHFMLSGKSTTVDGLEPNSVMLSFLCLDGRTDVESRNLFATLVSDQAQPLCYQDIFGSVFPDILPSSFANLSAGVFCVGDRPNRGDKLNRGGNLYCALIMGTDIRRNQFLCMSFFELSVAGAFANELAKETEFLRVKVQEKFICRFDDDYDVMFSAAFLL